MNYEQKSGNLFVESNIQNIVFQYLILLQDKHLSRTKNIDDPCNNQDKTSKLAKLSYDSSLKFKMYLSSDPCHV